MSVLLVFFCLFVSLFLFQCDILTLAHFKCSFISLAPYSSETLKYHFYFPRVGSFLHFPVTVSSARSGGDDMEFIASGVTSTCSVVLPSEMEVDTSSWEHVSARGSIDEVEAFLRRPDSILFGRGALDLMKIVWRLKDPSSYRVLMRIFEDKWIFPKQNEESSPAWQVWSYTVFHKDFSNDRLGRVPALCVFLASLH